jgi:FkbM family methyltransferase
MDIRNEKNHRINIEKVERNEQKLARDFIRKNDIVLELGARYGSVSCVINANLKNKLNQLSVEPDDRVWEALERNKKVNGCEFHILKGFISNVTLGLTNLDSWEGYGSTFVEKDDSKIKSYTYAEIKRKFNLDFNVLVADCEGFLERFLDENPSIYEEMRIIIFEADQPHKCNYNKIRNNLINYGFREVIKGHQNVWKKRKPIDIKNGFILGLKCL